MEDIRSDIYNPKFKVGDVVYIKDDKEKIPYYITDKEWVGTTDNGAWFYHFDINKGYEYEHKLEKYYNVYTETIGDWISVNKELPDCGVKVIFTDGVDIYTGCRKKTHHNNIWCIDFSNTELISVTYWMKIPKIPI